MFVRNLLILFVAYLLWKFLSKAWKFRKLILTQRDEILNQTRANEKQMREEGEINITSAKKSNQSSTDEGSYVDYEEVD